MTHLGPWNRWVWDVLHRFLGMRTISSHYYNDQWGQKVTPSVASPCLKNQFLIRTSSPSVKIWNSFKWRQKTLAFVRYDNGCSLVSLLLLWRNFSGSVPLSLAGPVLLLLLLLTWTFCSLSLDSPLPGCLFYFCPLPQAIHSAYCARTDEVHMRNTCFLHTLYNSTFQHDVFFPQQFTTWFLGYGEKTPLLKPGELLREWSNLLL